MSGRQIGQVVGFAIGFAIGGPGGAQLGMSIGGLAGSLLMPDVIGLQDQEGQRLQNIKVTTSLYGTSIKRVYGAYRVGGNIIWATDLKETKHVEEVEVGKGGSSESYDVITYTYAVDMAISLCEGPIAGVRKIWADSMKIYDISENGTTAAYKASEYASGPLTIYLGTPDQEVDWFLKANEIDSPAYRNVAYIVFNNFQLEKVGNRIPNITAEVVAHGNTTINVQIGPNATRQVPACSIGQTEGGDFRNPEHIYSSNEYDIVMYEGPWQQEYDSCTYLDIYRVNSDSLTPTFVKRYSYSESANTAVGTYGILYSTSENPVVRSTGGYIADQTHKIIDLETGYVVTTGSSPITNRGFIPSLTAPLLYDNGEFVSITTDTNYITKVWTAVPKGRSWSNPPYNTIPLNDDYHEDGWPILSLNNPPINNAIYLTFGEVYLRKISTYEYSIYYGANSTELLFSLPSTISKDCNFYIDSSKAYIYHLGFVYVISLISGSVKTYDIGTSLGASPNSFTSFNVNIGIVRVYLFPRYYNIYLDVIAPDSVSVSSICADLFISSGLESGDYDLSDTNNEFVDGFLLDKIGTARSAISILQSVYLFDLIESEFLIKSNMRGKISSRIIDEADLGANKEDYITHARSLQTELPKKVTITYSNPNIDYQNGSQSSQRIDGNSDNNIALELPMVIGDDKAKQVCEINLFGAWTKNQSFVFSLPSSYINLYVGQVVTIPYDGNLLDVRLTNITVETDYTLNIYATKESTYVSNAIGQDTSGGFNETILGLDGLTVLRLLDCPTLSNSLIDSYGLYVSASGYSEAWKGCGVYKSKDGGQSYDSIGVILSPIVSGSAFTALQSGPTTVWDLENTVEIITSGILDQSTVDNILAGNQYALLGNEVIQFVDVEERTDNGNFILSKLLRGRRGTEWAIDTHVVYEDFTLLNNRMMFGFSTINTTRHFKGVTLGTYLDDALEVSKLYTGVNLKPFSVGVLTNTTSTYDNTITWIRRDRYISGYMRNLPLSESTEEYIVNVYYRARDVILDTKTVTSEELVYSELDKTNAGIMLGRTLDFYVYQAGVIDGYQELIRVEDYPKTFVPYIMDTATYYWRFDEPSGLVFTDEMEGNVMTLRSGYTDPAQTGALPLSSSTSVKQRAGYGTASFFPRTGDFSISLFMIPSQTYVGASFISFGIKGLNEYMNLTNDISASPNIRFIDLVGFHNYDLDEWLHIVVTHNSTTSVNKIYLNGDFVSSKVRGVGLELENQKVYIDEVRLDEFAFHNDYELSAEEIKNMYDLSKTETL